MVYVKSVDSFVLKLRGHVTWLSQYTLQYENPRPGDEREIGTFVIRLDWPTITISSSEEWPDSIMTKVGHSYILFDKNGNEMPHHYERADEREFKGIGKSDKAKGWCYCEGGPRQGYSARPTIGSRTGEVMSLYDTVPGLDKVSRVEVSLYKPIREDFEIVSPALALKR
jgi:hypothetical protein